MIFGHSALAPCGSRVKIISQFFYVDSYLKSCTRKGDERGREMKETHAEALDKEQ
jgi:hypothetical protein